MYPKSIRDLIDCFKYLPGIGDKSAERMTFSMLNLPAEKINEFINTITNIRDNVKKCEICGNLCEDNICNICSNLSRNKKIIFVVEKAKDIYLFEKLGIYNGVYHVLDGLISPIDGIHPEDLKINELKEKIKNDNVEEIILALKPSIEGETTMQYIKKILEKTDVKVSKIATGIPLGTDMEYIDTLTLELALEERKNIS